MLNNTETMPGAGNLQSLSLVISKNKIKTTLEVLVLLSFLDAKNSPDQNNLREKRFTWLIIPGYSPSLWVRQQETEGSGHIYHQEHRAMT